LGKNNSSVSRVVPVFQRLYDRDPSGVSWLDGLLDLGSRTRKVGGFPRGRPLVPNHHVRWGRQEAALCAPVSLLEYLVRNITMAQVVRSSGSEDTLRRRRALALNHTRMVQEALAALQDRSNRQKRLWYVLEGASRPDAMLETDDFIVLVEGKRRERGCTTKTTWMPSRSQLLRHMDAALGDVTANQLPVKQIYGLLIVEGEGNDPCVPSKHWMDESAAQVCPQMLETSLPHRSDKQRSLLKSGVLGVTTWQAVCHANHIAWPPYRDS
jgi:hypothetical protein